MRAAAITLLIALLACPAFSDEAARGSLCVASLGLEPLTNRFKLCGSGNLSFRIDARQTIPWPRKESLKIEDLDLTKSHLAVAMCDGKPVQSARFKFSEYETDKLCLTFDEEADGYEGLRLWNAKHAPWCKCK